MENKIIRSGAQQPVDDAPRRIERRGRGRTLDQNSETEVSFGELWRVLRKRRIIILIATLAVFGPALAYTFLQTPRYRTTSIVEFNKANSDALALDDAESTLTGANAADYNVTLQTQVAALESDTLALQIVHNLKLEGRPEFTRKQSPLDYLRSAPDEANLPIEKATYRRATLLKAYHKNLKVEPISGTRMISVQFLDPDSETSAQIVNTLVRQLHGTILPHPLFRHSPGLGLKLSKQLTTSKVRCRLRSKSSSTTRNRRASSGPTKHTISS